VKNRIGYQFLFSLVAALGFYTMPIMLYPFGIVLTWLCLLALFNLLSYSKIQFFKNILFTIIVAGGLTFIFYSPVFIVSGFKVFSILNPTFIAEGWSDFVLRNEKLLTGTLESWHYLMPQIAVYFFSVSFLLSILVVMKKYPRLFLLVCAVPIFLIPLLCLQRVLPPKRLWLFLQPLYFIFSAVPIVYGIRFIFKSKSRLFSVTIYILSIFLTFFMVTKVIQSNSFIYEHKWVDAENITQYLKENLQERDKYIYSSTLSAPLEYYGAKYDIASRYIVATRGKISFKRLYLVLHEDDKSIDAILNVWGFRLDQKIEWRVVQSFSKSKVFIATLEQLYLYRD